jgi:hypothetical protein
MPVQSLFTFATYKVFISYNDGKVLSMLQGAAHKSHTSLFHQPDPSEYMLGLPRSRLRFRGWFMFVIFVGTLAALVLFAIENFIF